MQRPSKFGQDNARHGPRSISLDTAPVPRETKESKFRVLS